MYFKVYLIFWICWVSEGQRSDYENVRTFHMLRTTNITTCPNFYQKPIKFDVTFKKVGTKQIVTMETENHIDFNMTKATIRIHRCLDYEYACENFQSWNISPVCPFVRMKNQLWSPVFDSMAPSTWRRSCPLTKKGKYTFANTSLDVNEMMKFYKEASKYYWTIELKLYDNQIEVHCIFGAFHITSYTKKISENE